MTSISSVIPGAFVSYFVPGIDSTYCVIARVTDRRNNSANIAGISDGVILECVRCNVPNCGGTHAKWDSADVTVIDSVNVPAIVAIDCDDDRTPAIYSAIASELGGDWECALHEFGYALSNGAYLVTHSAEPTDSAYGTFAIVDTDSWEMISDTPLTIADSVADIANWIRLAA